MKTYRPIALRNTPWITTWLVAALVATISNSAWAQDQPAKPFVLKPASPSSLEEALPPTGYPAQFPSPYSTSYPAMYPTTGERSTLPPNVPSGAAAHSTAMSRPARTVTSGPLPGQALPGNAAPGETIYVGPDGRVVQPTHVYRSGRVYRVHPSQQNGRVNNGGKKSAASRPQIDYSLAPVQPAIPPRLGPQTVPQIAAKTRIVDGAPLLRQETVVSADGSLPQASSRRSHARSPNTPWLTGVRRMMDGNRSTNVKSAKPNCPNCGKPKSSVSVASRSTGASRK